MATPLVPSRSRPPAPRSDHREQAPGALQPSQQLNSSGNEQMTERHREPFDKGPRTTLTLSSAKFATSLPNWTMALHRGWSSSCEETKSWSKRTQSFAQGWDTQYQHWESLNTAQVCDQSLLSRSTDQLFRFSAKLGSFLCLFCLGPPPFSTINGFRGIWRVLRFLCAYLASTLGDVQYV
jgi:hypothetical protein